MNCVCFVFSPGLTCPRQLQPPVVICVSTFVHMRLWATLLENEAWDRASTGHGHAGNQSHIMPKGLKGKRGRLFA